MNKVNEPILADAVKISRILLPTYKSNLWSDEPVDFKALARANDSVRPIPRLVSDDFNEIDKMIAEKIDTTTDDVELLSYMQSIKQHEVPLTKTHRRIPCKN